MTVDMQLLGVLGICFVLFSVMTFTLLPGLYDKVNSQWQTSENYVADNLEAMFFRNSKEWAKKIKVASIIVLTLLGFWLPNSLSGLDRVILDNAIRLNKQGLYQESILLMSGLKKGSSPLLHNELGVAYLGVNDVDLAVSNFKKAIDILPEYARAYANLGVAYRILDKNEDAAFEEKRAEDFFRYNLDEEQIYGQDSSLQSAVFIRCLFALIFFFLSLSLPKWITAFLRHRRESVYSNQLSDSLKMLSNSLKAGMSLLQSIEMMVDQGKGVVKQEFELVLKEHQLGLSLGDALENLKQRIPVEDNIMFIDTVALLTETGGDIPTAIENVVHTISERKRIKDKISAMTAEGKVQTIVLAIIPIVIGWVMNAAQKETFSLMYTTVIGWICLIVMFLWGALGLYMMVKICRVKI